MSKKDRKRAQEMQLINFYDSRVSREDKKEDVSKQLPSVVEFFKERTAYEVGRRDWDSDVCSSELGEGGGVKALMAGPLRKEHFLQLP